jgi:hypothetical protein
VVGETSAELDHVFGTAAASGAVGGLDSSDGVHEQGVLRSVGPGLRIFMLPHQALFGLEVALGEIHEPGDGLLGESAIGTSSKELLDKIHQARLDPVVHVHGV